jgi:hypothetical protein
MTTEIYVSRILNIRYPLVKYKILDKNKEVAAVTATSKKGRDIMLLFILKSSAAYCIQQLIKIALDAIK